MEIGFRKWPWSSLLQENIEAMPSGTIPFIVSPVLEISEGFSYKPAHRLVKFESIGSSFKSSPIGIARCLLEVPLHDNWEVTFTRRDQSHKCSWRFNGLSSESNAVSRELVETWGRVFDELAFGANQKLRPWTDVSKVLKEIEEGQPECSLIVIIADQFIDRLPHIVTQARKILSRRNEMVKLQKLQETDKSFLSWYVKQVGSSIAEKAGVKKEVPGMIRFESYDTLENRVLKKFISLCQSEANRYVEAASKAGYQKNHSRILNVRRFREVCREQLKRDIFTNVRNIEGIFSPNYVLQSDVRYRDVWVWYQKLVRRQLEQDQVWSWQGRVWADVVRLLFGAALAEEQEVKSDFWTKEIKTSYVDIHPEHIAGRRLLGRTLPGPFVARKIASNFIIDFVDPNPKLMDQYKAFKGSNLSALGGHLYIVITPIGTGTEVKPTVLVVWALNRAPSQEQYNEKDISLSALKSIQEWQISNKNIHIHGILAINRPYSTNPQETLSKEVAARDLSSGNAPYLLTLTVPNHPRNWKSAVDALKENFSFFGELACDAR